MSSANGVLSSIAASAALDGLEPLGEAVERRLRVVRGEAALHLGQPRLQRRQPGQHRRDAGVLLGVQPGQLLRERGEGGPGRVLQRAQPVAERGEPRLDPGQRRLRVAGGHRGLDRGDAADQRLGQRLLLGVQPRQLLGERRAGAGRGLQRRELAPRRATLALQRLEPRLDPLQRLAAALDQAEPRLQRLEPGEHRLEAGVAALVQPRQPLGELRNAARREGGDARLEPGGRGRLRRLQLVETAAQRREQRPRLGRLAHLLERAHPGAQLVQPGERGLERRVLVADQPEQLPGHRLQPLLGRRRLGAERVEPQPELGLGLGERLQPVGGRARPRRQPPAPLAEGQPEGAEGGEARRAQSRNADPEGLHASPPCCKPPQSSAGLG